MELEPLWEILDPRSTPVILSDSPISVNSLDVGKTPQDKIGLFASRSEYFNSQLCLNDGSVTVLLCCRFKCWIPITLLGIQRTPGTS